MLFTDANVDHLGGLTVLRQHGTHGFRAALERGRSRDRRRAAGLRAVRAAAASLARGAPRRALRARRRRGRLVGRQLTVRAIPVAGTTPGYDGRRHVRGAVVAFEIRALRESARLLFAPVFADIDDALRAAIEAADVAFLDGSFYSDDELVAQGLASKTRAIARTSAGRRPERNASAFARHRERGSSSRISITRTLCSIPIRRRMRACASSAPRSRSTGWS